MERVKDREEKHRLRGESRKWGERRNKKKDEQKQQEERRNHESM